VFGQPHPIAPNVEGQLIRIAQEAVNNAVRHACATHIQLTLTFSEHQLILEVFDNGSGFDIDAATTPQSGHYGIVGMRERATGIKAQLEISSEIEKGTRVRVTLGVASSPRELTRAAAALATATK
jgi:signal transduction histidine kinase